MPSKKGTFVFIQASRSVGLFSSLYPKIVTNIVDPIQCTVSSETIIKMSGNRRFGEFSGALVITKCCPFFLKYTDSV